LLATGPAPKRRRLSYEAGARAALAQEAEAFRRDYVSEHGTARGVWVAFQETLAAEGVDALPTKQAIRQAYRAELQRDKSVQPAPFRKSARRAVGGGRRAKAPDLGEELWHWFVDELHQIQARTSSATVMAQAEALRADLLELHHHKVQLGRADPCQPPALPKLSPTWLHRWREKYGISFRQVNLRYKISAAKRDLRLRVCWCNALRLRVLHRSLVGEDTLRFVGLDQKPLWFNTSHASKTLALKGSTRVVVKENTAASRERFTVFTNCLSWTPTRPARAELLAGGSGAEPASSSAAPAAAGVGEGPARAGLKPPARAGEEGVAAAGAADAIRAPADLCPPVAVLFRAAGGTGSTMRKRLRTPDSTLLQFAPKGSYRLENLLEFFKWCFGPAPSPRESIVVVLDWYAVHLDSAVDDALHAMGHAVLRIGGGVTPDIQVGDTHRHGPYTKAYRDREQEDARRQQLLRPGRMPESSRQTVLDRAVAAWRDLDHSGGRREWVEDGFLGALDGSEDGLLRRDLLPVWRRLGMPAWRSRVIEEVEALVARGTITEWSQYPSVLESYDDHEGLREGMEAAKVEVVGDLAEGDADAASSDEAPADILAEEGGAAEEPGTLAAPEHVVADELAVLGLLPEGLEERARADLAKEVATRRLAALSDAAASLRGIDDGAVRMLENRLAGLQRKQQGLGREEQVWLRARVMMRKDDEAAARAAAAEEDRERDRLAAELKVAKAVAAVAKSTASTERAETKRTVTKIKAEQAHLRREKAKDSQRRELLRRNFVDWKLGQARAWFRDPKQGKGRARAVLTQLASFKMSAMKPAPEPWSAKDRDGYLEVTPGTLVPLAGLKKDAMTFASENLAHRLYGGRHPAEASSAKSACARAVEMLDECLPGFNSNFPGFMLVPNTLRAHGGNLDITLFEVLWRFSQAVKGTAFPHGVREWPLRVADMNAFVEAQGRGDLVMREDAPAAALAAAAATASGAAAAASSASGSASAAAPARRGAASSAKSAGATAPDVAAKAAAAAFAKEMAGADKVPRPAPPGSAPARPLRIDPVPLPKAAAKGKKAAAETRPKEVPKGLAAKWSEPLG